MNSRKQIGLGIVVVGAGALAGVLTRGAEGGRRERAPADNRPFAALPGAPPPSRHPGPARSAPVLASHAYSVPVSVGAPGYDPIKLGLALGPRALFNQEPRDPSWAPAMERLMTPLVQKDLHGIPGIRDVSVDCRTTGCRVSYTAGGNEQNFAAAMVLTALWGGGVSGKTFGEFTTFFRGQRFDGIDPTNPEALIARLQDRRSEQLAKTQRLYERGWPRYKYVPRAYWPEQ